MRLRVIKNSVLMRLVNRIMMAILILSGIVTAMSIPLTSYAQSDTDYDSEEVMPMDDGQAETDYDSEELMPMDESQTDEDGSTDVSDSNNGMVAMDDFNQVGADEIAVDNGVDGNQDNTDSDDDTLLTDGTQVSGPTADAGQDFEVDENTDVSLDGSLSNDQDGEISSYSWEQTDGFPSVELNDADSAQPSFIAPEVESNQELAFQLRVTDNDGIADTDSVVVLVMDITNPEVPDDVESNPPDEQDTEQTPQVSSDLQAPSANTLNCTDNQTDCNPLRQEQPVISQTPKCPDGNMTGDGCVPSEPSLDCPDGNMTEEGCPVPSEPSLDCPDGNMTEEGCIQQDNILPVANAGEDQYVEANSSVILDASGSYDPDGNLTSFIWEQIEGPSMTLVDPDIPLSSFIAPISDSPTELKFQVSVTDNADRVNSDSVSIFVNSSKLTETPMENILVILDQVPKSLYYNETYVFTGTLHGTNNPEGRYIQIKAEDGSDKGETLAFDDVDENTGFAAPWYPGDARNNYSIFAAYEDEYGNIVKSDTYDVKILFPTFSNLTLETANIRPFIKINHADWNQNPLNVYVIPKDQYSKKFIPQTESAIKDLSLILKSKSGNSNAWDFKITRASNYPNFIQTLIRPINIAVELKHEGSDCKPQATGWWHDENPIEQIFNRRAIIEVFTGCNNPNLNAKDVDVYKATMHEMIHGLGLGHAYNELGDFMCGLDPIDWKQTVYTCENGRDNYDDNDDDRPTEFDYRALEYAYDSNGFETPNKNIVQGYKYFCQPLPCEPSSGSTKPKEQEPPIRIVNPTKPKTPTQEKEQDVANRKITVTTSPTKTLTENFYFIKKIGFPGTGKGQILEPTDLSIDTNHDIMYVADKNNDRIQKLDLSGKYVASWGSRGSKAGQFLGPADLAVDYSSNLIFVADLANNRIEKFDTNGNFLDMWGSFGKDFGQFDHIGDIALDTKERLVYVTDIGNHRVQKFDYDGKFIGSWGSLGSGEGRFDRPAGLEYDSSGIVYVVDTNNNRIQKFDTEGNFLGMWGEFGKGPGQFDNPVSLNIDPTSDYLYVSDSGNKRIQIFDHNGKYLGAWGTDGGGDGEFERPVSVAFGPSGEIYVVDKDKGDIQIFAKGESNSKQRWTSAAEGNMTDGCFGEQNCKEYCETNPCVEETSGPSITTEKRYDRTVQFSADLRGENEVPPTDSEASGIASFYIDKNIISYRIEVTGMDEEPVTAAHLHNEKEGSNGEIVVSLATDNPAEGSIGSSDLEGPLEGKTIGNLVNLMKKGSIYVNLHSNIFPDGELRGQVK